MDDLRPDPNTLLHQLNLDEPPKQKVGKLKIFFGYAAGVGKTYAMLEAAHHMKALGHDVVAGYVEPHARPETLALLEGLEQLPVAEVPYKGITLREFDLDAALARRPEIILVDELAHTNCPGSRHLKRYQDIQELLRAGIHVYTTVNVQHLESLNDMVASITGVAVAERVPDFVFDNAYQVEVVDIEPEELLERLRGGKVYRAAQAQKAMNHFFTVKNLAALREIALRRTADRLNRAAAPVDGSKAKTAEHILICLSPSPSNAKVIRTAARMCEAFRGAFTALFVETSDFSGMSDKDRKRLRQNLYLAEQLGARIVTVYGDDVPLQIAAYARVSGISKIIIGRSNSKRRLFSTKSSLIERLIDLAPDVDIYVIPDSASSYAEKQRRLRMDVHFSLRDSLCTLGVLALCTAIGFLFLHFGFSVSNTITMYILGVLVIALITRGHAYSAIASILSVLLFNFCFTEPRFTLEFEEGYGVTFIIMFLSAVLSSTLAMKVKDQAKLAARKAYRTEVLLQTSQKLHQAEGMDEILELTAVQLCKLLDRTVLFYSVQPDDVLSSPRIFQQDTSENTNIYVTHEERAVADWVLKNNKHAGATTHTLPSAKCLYLAVRGTRGALAVAGIAMDGLPEPDAFEKNLMLAILDECGLALEKDMLIHGREAAQA